MPYDVFQDHRYCYRGTDILKNRAGLRNADDLEAFELEMSTVRASEPLPSGRFGVSHYRQIHRHIFQDVYSWAGQFRSVRTAKGGNWFCYPEFIASSMETLFQTLNHPRFKKGALKAEFLPSAASFLSELNAIHPFREGNGRAQLAFMHLLGLRAGYPFEFIRVEQATFIPAMIASFGGNEQPLVDELESLLS